MRSVSRVNDQRLLALLRGTGELIPNARPASLSDSEWDGVVETATKHGVGPLLYQRLMRGGLLPEVPQPVMGRLREMYLVNAARNALLYRHLGQVLHAFQQAAIPVVLLKGAHLAALVYDEVAARKMGDLDLLIKQSDLAKAAAQLLALGYACEISADAAAIEDWCITHPQRHHLPPFYGPPDTRIELHWSILNNPHPAALAAPWATVCRAEIFGVQTLVLAPEVLLLHLCLHAEHHHFRQGIRPLCDIAAVVRRWDNQLDWAELRMQADRWRASKCVHLGLWLSRQLLQAPVPETILRELQPRDFSAEAALLAQEIVLAGEELSPEESAALVPWSVRLLPPDPEPRPRWISLWALLCPSREQMTRYMAIRHGLPLTGWRRFTCYGTRAIDIIIRMGRFWLSRSGRAMEGVRLLRKTVRFRQWLATEDTKLT